MHPQPLPPTLAPAFPVGVALEQGIAPGRLRRADLERSTWGVRSSVPCASLGERCARLAIRMTDDAFFSHATAARLHGAPLPYMVEQATSLHVSHPAPDAAPHARGIRGHSLCVAPTDVTLVGGLRCTSAVRTWCDLGAELTVPDLVAVGDFLLHQLLCTIDELRAGVYRMFGRRGAKRLRLALELLDGRAESRPESHLRVILHEAGFTDVVTNHTIVVSETGQQRRPDFMLPEFRLILEYQGDYHRTREQWRKDMTRRGQLEAQGWRVLEINADDLRDPIELIVRIRALIARG